MTSSGRVLQKIGMEKEGVLRDHIMKEGKYEDLVYYGIINRKKGSLIKHVDYIWRWFK